MRPIHDLVWITKIDGQLTPAGTPVGEVVSDVAELGEGSYELHWFGSASEAVAFKSGILSVGINSIDVTIGIENAQQSVLVHRLDRDSSNAKSLEDAVPLVEHASARNRRINVIWANEIGMLRGASRNPDSSFTAAQISRDTDEERLPFVFKYDRWEKHPDFENIKKAGVKNFEIVRRDGQRLLLWKLRELEAVRTMGRSRSRKYREQIDEIVRQFNGRLVGDEVAFPINNDLQGLLTRIIPSYRAVYDVDDAAKNDERRRKVYESPQTQQVITLLVDGGTIDGGSKASIIPDSGKPSRITQKLLSDLVDAEIVVLVDGSRSTYKLAHGVQPLDADPYDIAQEPALTPK
jgi:hypothetical protein